MSEHALEAIYNYIRLSDRIGTSGQPTEAQLPAIQEAGFEVVVNLLPDTKVLAGEPERVQALGMEYISIPVWWDSPELSDLERFFEVMEVTRRQRVFVHCAANMRVSAFFYLYRILREKMPGVEAQHDLHRIWIPNPIWQRFIEQALASQAETPPAENAPPE